MGIRGARTGSLCVVFVAALALVSACSGDAQEPSQLNEGKQNGDSEPRTPPDKPDPEPTPDGADEPDQSDHEQELYDATVTFYDTINEAYKTLDPGPLEELVVPGVRAAEPYLDQIRWMKSNRYEYTKLPPSVVSEFELQKDADDTVETVTCTVSADPPTIVDANGEPVDLDLERKSAPVRITFKKQGETWLVVSQVIED